AARAGTARVSLRWQRGRRKKACRPLLARRFVRAERRQSRRVLDRRAHPHRPPPNGEHRRPAARRLATVVEPAALSPAHIPPHCARGMGPDPSIVRGLCLRTTASCGSHDAAKIAGDPGIDLWTVTRIRLCDWRPATTWTTKTCSRDRRLGRAFEVV